MQSPQTAPHSAFGVHKEPAKTSCKARWVAASELQAGDVILWCVRTLEQPMTVEAVRVGWWNRVYVQSASNPTALACPHDQCVRITDRD